MADGCWLMADSMTHSTRALRGLSRPPPSEFCALATHGLSPGHTSYLVRRPQGDVLIARDVTYDLPALESQRDQGFIAKVDSHHETLSRVRALVRTGVAYLPIHDPTSPTRVSRCTRPPE